MADVLMLTALLNSVVNYPAGLHPLVFSDGLPSGVHSHMFLEK